VLQWFAGFVKNVFESEGNDLECGSETCVIFERKGR